MSEQKILVIGSSNTDMVIRTGHLPLPGETVIGGTFFMNPGGKGANQAVAVARLGGRVTFVCKTGSDIFGHQACQIFMEEGIDASFVFSDTKNPSGVALITVDDRAENCIVVAPGANAHLTVEDLHRSVRAIEAADIVLLQLEIPMEMWISIPNRCNFCNWSYLCFSFLLIISQSLFADLLSQYRYSRSIHIKKL